MHLMVRLLLKGPGETGCREHPNIQQKQMQSPAHGEEGPHALGQAGDQLVGKQLWRAGPEGPCGHQVEREPAMDCCSEGGQQYPGPH